MENLFSGLEAFGLNNLSNMNIYDKKEEKEENKPDKAVKNEFNEEENIFDKTYTCPVCDQEFKSKMVKAGKVKLQALDTDLRPRYHNMDPLKYDAVVCPNCGYAALNRFFKYVSSAQATLIKNNISMNFRGLKEKDTVYAEDDGITRDRLALLNSKEKKAKTS